MSCYWQELDHMVEELENIAIVKLLRNRSILSLIGNVERSSLILEKVYVSTKLINFSIIYAYKKLVVVHQSHFLSKFYTRLKSRD